MLDIATAAYWPMSDGNGNITETELDDQWVMLKKFALMWQKRDKVKAEKLEQSFTHYEAIREPAFKNASIEQKEIWHPTLMDRIDDVYVKLLRPDRTDFGRMSSEKWKRAAEIYWERTERLCMAWWRAPAHGPATEATMLAKKHAHAKFRWFAFRRKMGHTMDLPLPTKSSIEDMYNVLHEASFGIQYISRIMDPLVDKAITGADTDIYDHTSHMQVFIQDPVLMGHTPVNGVLHLWQWIFAHLNDLQEADLEMQSVVKVEDTRFFNVMMNGLRPTAKALMMDEDLDKFIELSKFWLDAFNERDNWQDYDTDDVKTIHRHFKDYKYGPVSRPTNLVVPAKVLGARINGRRADHQISAPIHQSFTDNNKATRLLTRNVVEWRAVDSHNIGLDFAVLALWVYVARAIYDRVTKHMLGTPAGVRLRQEFLDFLQQHWAPAPGQKTDSRPVPTRPQWDTKHVEEIMMETPPPPTDRREALDLQAKKDEIARWDQYTQDAKNIVSTVRKSTAARAFPAEKDAVNPAVAAALDNLLLEITRNANRLEYRRLHPEGGVYVNPGPSLRLLNCKPLVSAPDPLAFADLEAFKAHDPAAYNAFVVNRKAHHLKLQEEKEKNPKLKILELSAIRPQHIPPSKSDPDGDIEEQKKESERALKAQKQISSAFFDDLDFSDDEPDMSKDSTPTSGTATPVVTRSKTQASAQPDKGKGRADVDMRDADESAQDDGDVTMREAAEGAQDSRADAEGAEDADEEMGDDVKTTGESGDKSSSSSSSSDDDDDEGEAAVKARGADKAAQESHPEDEPNVDGEDGKGAREPPQDTQQDNAAPANSASAPPQPHSTSPPPSPPSPSHASAQTPSAPEQPPPATDGPSQWEPQLAASLSSVDPDEGAPLGLQHIVRTEESITRSPVEYITAAAVLIARGRMESLINRHPGVGKKGLCSTNPWDEVFDYSTAELYGLIRDAEKYDTDAVDYALAIGVCPLVKNERDQVATLPPAGLAPKYHDDYYCAIAHVFGEEWTRHRRWGGALVAAAMVLNNAITRPAWLRNLPRVLDCSQSEPDLTPACTPCAASQEDWDRFLESPLFPKLPMDVDMDLETPRPSAINSPLRGASIQRAMDPPEGRVLVPETPAPSQDAELTPEASSQPPPSSQPQSTPTPSPRKPTRETRTSARAAAAAASSPMKRGAAAVAPEDAPPAKRTRRASTAWAAASTSTARTKPPTSGKGKGKAPASASALPIQTEHEELVTSDQEFEDAANDSAV